jgi:hypothetical protein
MLNSVTTGMEWHQLFCTLFQKVQAELVMRLNEEIEKICNVQMAGCTHVLEWMPQQAFLAAPMCPQFQVVCRIQYKLHVQEILFFKICCPLARMQLNSRFL